MLNRCLPIISALALSALSLSAGLKDGDCLDCHGDSSLAKTNAAGRAVSLFVDAALLKSSIHATNSCVACHADVTAKHPDDGKALAPVDCRTCHERQTASFNASVHARALKTGHENAPGCTDCHGTHHIISDKSPDSPIYRTRQAGTCGQCHDREARDWLASGHGRDVEAGSLDAPACTTCHNDHQIRALTGTSARTITDDVCAPCHASGRMNYKYNLPADRVQTFLDSYHGLASKSGDQLVASCADCHGYHRVLPSSDTNSLVNPLHLVETCGRCHENANAEFSLGRIHVQPDGQAPGDDFGSRLNQWVRRIYLLLILLTIGAMVAHNGIIFIRKFAARLRGTVRPVLRMTASQRWQHLVLAVSFIVLALTGFALKFPDSWLAALLGSHEPFRRWLHRISGVILLLVGLYHLVYVVATRDGRRLAADLLPVKKDLADVWKAVRYLCGLSKEKPRVGRFGYAEKMEYWAVVWGTLIMGITGIAIWMKIDVTAFLPRWVVAVAVTIHYYEAVLACLAILVWHFYQVMFDPDVYPVNTACLDGRISEEFQAHEHPLEREDEEPRVEAPGESESGKDI